MLPIAVQQLDDVCVVAVNGEIDVANAADLRAALARVQRPGRPSVVLDLCRVPFLDSVGLAALIGARRRSQRVKRGFAIVAEPDGAVARLLKLTGIDDALPLFATLDTARRALTGARVNGAG